MLSLKVLRHGSIIQFYLQIHHACLSFVSVHQVAPPLTEMVVIQLQLTVTVQLCHMPGGTVVGS